MKYLKIILFTLVALAGAVETQAKPGDKALNRPYADNRKWHLGFSVGANTFDLQFTHNGFVTDEGETWFMEQPTFNPGFCVNGLIDFRLSQYFNLRFTPGMYFGNRVVTMVNTSSDTYQSENVNLKSTFVVLPIDLKFSGMRMRNVRPYVVGGVMPAFDVNKRRRDALQLNTFDCYLTVGFGLDTYLPYFKFIPEIKFCFGLADVLRHNRPDLEDDPLMLKYTNSLKKATSRMVVLTFYFE